jgi:hypothetical protein
VAGIKLNSSPSGSNFIINADNFKVYTGGGTLNPFSVSGNTVSMTNVDISGNLVVDGTLVTSKVASNAITTTAGGVLTSSNGGSYGLYGGTIFSWTMDSAGGPVWISTSISFSVSYGSTANVLQIRQNGTVISQCNVNSGGLYNLTVYVPSPGTGSQSYDVYLLYAASNPPNWNPPSSFFAMGLKR